MSNYYDSIIKDCNQTDESKYIPTSTFNIRTNDICQLLNTEYYQVRKTKAKINVYIRKSN